FGGRPELVERYVLSPQDSVDVESADLDLVDLALPERLLQRSNVHVTRTHRIVQLVEISGAKAQLIVILCRGQGWRPIWPKRTNNHGDTENTEIHGDRH